MRDDFLVHDEARLGFAEWARMNEINLEDREDWEIWWGCWYDGYLSGIKRGEVVHETESVLLPLSDDLNDDELQFMPPVSSLTLEDDLEDGEESSLNVESCKEDPFE